MTSDRVLIVPYRDGPYLVRGPVELRDQSGAEIEAGRSVVALCRCGRSRLRPFCDGSHHLVRFSAPSGREARGGDRIAGEGSVSASEAAAAARDDPEALRRDILVLRSRLRTLAAAASCEPAEATSRSPGVRELTRAEALLNAAASLLGPASQVTSITPEAEG